MTKSQEITMNSAYERLSRGPVAGRLAGRVAVSAVGASVAQVAIARVMARASADQAALVPLIGARRRDRRRESLGALPVKLSPEQLAEIERAVPPNSAVGGRYPDARLAHMDSKRTE